MNVPHPLSDALVEQIAQRFRILGDPTRIKILDRLRDGQASAAELIELLATSQQNVSKHLAILSGAGIVGRSKSDGVTHYRIVDESVMAMCEHVCGALARQVEQLSEALGGALSGARR